MESEVHLHLGLRYVLNENVGWEQEFLSLHLSYSKLILSSRKSFCCFLVQMSPLIKWNLGRRRENTNLLRMLREISLLTHL